MIKKIIKNIEADVIIGLIITAIFIAGVSAETNTFGYATTATSSSDNANYIIGTLFMCQQDSEAQSITVRLGCWEKTLKAKCAIYSSDKILIASTEEKVLGYTQRSWQKFNFIAKPNLEAGKSYYLVSWANSANDRVYDYYDSVSGYTSIIMPKTYSSSFPTSLSGTILSNEVYSIYCTYTTDTETVVVPTVTTITATTTSCDSTTLNGDLSNLGGASSCEVWFEYGSSNLYSFTTSQQSKTSIGLFFSVVSLSESTTYHFRAVASNSAGTVYGSDMTVTTPSCGNEPTEGMFGYDTKGSNSITGTNRIIGGKYVCPMNAVAQSITVYIHCWHSDCKVKCAIYSDDRTTKIGETEERTVGYKQGWQTFNFVTQPTLTANTAYYLCVWTNSGYPRYNSIPNNELCYSSTYTYGPTFPSSISGSIYPLSLSIYCTYSSAGESPSLACSPSSYSFGTMQKGQIASTTFSIWNSGTGTLNYSFAESTNWLIVSPTSGTSTGEHDTITISIDTTGLNDGSYTCPISINNGDGTFTVSFTIGEAESFTLIAMPDIQNYASAYPQIILSQSNYIVNNKNSMNIVWAGYEGDLVNNPGTTEYTRVDAGVNIILNSGLPLTIIPGNHDFDDGGVVYKQWFPVSRFTGYPWWGGNYGTTTYNNYVYFNASGMQFIVIGLNWNPSNAEIAWADGILQANSNKRAIVVTHCILDDDGTWEGNGQLIYDELKDNPNLFLMLCGHMYSYDEYGIGENMRTETYNGNTVCIILANYQHLPNRANSFLRIMEFVPSSNQINVKTYSPYLDEWQTDANSQFTLSYDMSD